ncbi:MAG: hypothetical protein EAZ30_16130 [Betaproteobacteria bacterium]|nr:MAG: hypothetical protein EAZ30_16130 [Betaproteobacteria bacterium]
MANMVMLVNLPEKANPAVKKTRARPYAVWLTLNGAMMQNESCQGSRALLRVAASSTMTLNLAPFGRWTLRDKAPQRRLALRSGAR